VADTCAQCGGQLGTSPSPDFCSDSCQSAWHSKSAIHAIARPARRVSSDRVPPVPAATWPKPPQPIPHPAGGITYPASESDYRQWLETDPDPAPLPPVPESNYPPGAVDLPVEHARPSAIRRILNATRKARS